MPDSKDDHESDADEATTGTSVAPKATASIQELLSQMNTMAMEKVHGKPQEAYKFWSTQPVPKIDEVIEQSGPIEPNMSRDQVSATPHPLPATFEWCDMDLTLDADIQELYTLLAENYVEDVNSTFRFDYSPAVLEWALKPPGWKKPWHAGIRVSATKKLVAFIAATPTNMRVYTDVIPMVEINFLCVHKKLRSKRLAPVLIREITRRVQREGRFQAVYTAGAKLPRPVSSVQYFHRSLNPKKLIECGFAFMKRNMTMSGMVKLYKLNPDPLTPGFREARKEDAVQIHALLSKYLSRLDMHQQFSLEEVEHYMLPREKIIFSYVVEDPDSGEVTAFVSFYDVPNKILGVPKHTGIEAAFMWFYAYKEESQLKPLIRDALIMAKKTGHDVFNCLNMMDNDKFMKELKFAPGDGSLNFYLYNWRCKEIPSNKQGFVVI